MFVFILWICIELTTRTILIWKVCVCFLLLYGMIYELADGPVRLIWALVILIAWISCVTTIDSVLGIELRKYVRAGAFSPHLIYAAANGD